MQTHTHTNTDSTLDRYDIAVNLPLNTSMITSAGQGAFKRSFVWCAWNICSPAPPQVKILLMSALTGSASLVSPHIIKRPSVEQGLVARYFTVISLFEWNITGQAFRSQQSDYKKCRQREGGRETKRQTGRQIQGERVKVYRSAL